MEKEREYKHTYLILTDLFYHMVIMFPVITFVVAFIFFMKNIIIIPIILVILGLFSLIYLIIKLKDIRSDIYTNIARYIVQSYIKENRFFYSQDITIKNNTIDYIIFTPNGLVALDIRGIYHSESFNGRDNLKFAKEKEMLEILQKYLVNDEIEALDIPIKYIIAYTENLTISDIDSKETFVTKINMYDVPREIKKFIIKNSDFKINFHLISKLMWKIKNYEI